MKKEITTTNKNSKLTLAKSKKTSIDLVEDESWMQRLWTWADINNISQYLDHEKDWIGLPRNKDELLELDAINLEKNDLLFIPKEIGNLTNLTRLNLSRNQLTELPVEICDLINLTELVLTENKLTALPKEIGNLTNLTGLYLFGNQLTELPKEIGNLTNLTLLELPRNQLTELPVEICDLTNLAELYLIENKLTALPKEIGNLTNLTGLYLFRNQLTELPVEICDLTNLTELYLTENKLTELSKKIGNLTNLTGLNLSRNQLTELPVEIYDLTNLTELYLSHNQLTELSKKVEKLINLTKLILSRNQLTELPVEICDLTNLTELYLSRNQLTELSKKIGNLTNLTGLYLSKNKLTELPVEICSLTNLTELYLIDNKLTTLPKDITNLTNLTELNLKENPNLELTHKQKEWLKELRKSGCCNITMDDDLLSKTSSKQTADIENNEDGENLNYFSTTATAKEHNLKARPHLFDRLIELNLLYKDSDNKYKLTTNGENIGGEYRENEKGDIWVVWKEHSLDKIIEGLKENLGFVSSDVQKLTPHQLEVYSHIIEDINDIFNDNYTDDRISLSGSAGVGKTFLTIKIIEELQKKNHDLVVVAPTHKALSVITDNLKRYGIKNVKSKTLHSFLKLKLETDQESGKKLFVADTNREDKDYTSILIIDESSMIGNDLFGFINDDIKNSRVGAVLFVGDPYQLPPVNSEKNSIFNLEQSYFLEQVIRQEKDSYIISIATKIRDSIINKDFSHSIESFFSDNQDGLKVFSDRDKFLAEFYTNDRQNWNNKNQIIADYTNDSVDFYNKISREKYWEDRGNLKPKQIEVGDVVVFQDSYVVDKEVIHQNGSIVQIKKCSKQHDDKLELKYWLCTDEYGDDFRVMKNSSNPSYMKMLQEKIDAAKSARHGFDRRNKWVDYYKLKERYASIKFNYASTIHKLQGSTYETVFIDIRKMISLYKYSDKTDPEFLYRLLYVAVTRASKDIVILK